MDNDELREKIRKDRDMIENIFHSWGETSRRSSFPDSDRHNLDSGMFWLKYTELNNLINYGQRCKPKNIKYEKEN